MPIPVKKIVPNSTVTKLAHSLYKTIVKQGITPFIGFELEFYLELAQDSGPQLISAENSQNILLQTKIENLQNILQNSYAISIYPERGPWQFECSSQPLADIDALADYLAFVREKITQTAAELGLTAIFHPKPYPDTYGSSLQLNLSLHKLSNIPAIKDQKIPYIPDNPVIIENNLFAGQTIQENAILALTIDRILANLNAAFYLLTYDDPMQFTRFDSRFMAPTNISWGINNRTTALRIPSGGLAQNRRIELRIPGANCCIYRSLSLLMLGVAEAANAIASVGEPADFLYPKRLYTAIYGNAYEPLYQLSPLPRDNQEAAKLFTLNTILDRLIL